MGRISTLSFLKFILLRTHCVLSTISYFMPFIAKTFDDNLMHVKCCPVLARQFKLVFLYFLFCIQLSHHLISQKTFICFAISVLMALLLLFLIASLVNADLIVIKTNLDLELYLCDNYSFSDKVILFLLDSSNYNLSSGQFCQVSHQARDITISSNSTNGSVITCTYNKTTDQQRGGLVFFNSIVTLQQVTFQHCGTFLNTISDSTVTNYFNSSSLYYSPYHAAVLVFVNCQVNLTNVNIYYSFGFAMIGVNLQSSSINEVNVSFGFIPAKNRAINIGSGIMIHYLDTNYDFSLPMQVSINRSDFYSNYATNDEQYCIESQYQRSSKSEIINAAALTVLHTMKDNTASVVIDRSNFTNNYNFRGAAPAGLLIVHYHSFVESSTVISKSDFTENINSKCCGAGLSFYWFMDAISSQVTTVYPIIIKDTHFRGHHGIEIGDNADHVTGAVFMGIVNSVTVSLLIVIQNCTFSHNANMYTGGAALHVVKYTNRGNTSVILKDITATENSQFIRSFYRSSVFGSFTFYNINQVVIMGDTSFSNNYGSVIHSLDSTVYITGNVTFVNNTGIYGTAVYFKGRGHLLFNSTNVLFGNNHAQKQGGAIFIDSNIPGQFRCTILIDQFSSNITFSNNTAIQSGNSLYNKNLHSCFLNKDYLDLLSPENVLEYYFKSFVFVENASERLQISTQATKIIDCHYPLRQYLNYLLAYPGQSVSFTVAATGLTKNYSLYTSVNANIFSKDKLHPLRLSGNEYSIMESKTNCTTISFMVFSSHSSNETLFGDMTLSIPQVGVVTKAVIYLLPCPLGFSLKESTGSCDCSPVLQKIASVMRCNITNRVIERPHKVVNIWGGQVTYNGTKSFGISLQCPPMYCRSENLHLCSSGNSITLTEHSLSTSGSCSENSIDRCVNNRTGILCGKCSNGLSVTFGTNKCKECNNWWSLILLVYAATGPLLIYLLYTLKLTLTTGTLNGIIFYAQVAHCGMVDLLELSTHSSNDETASSIALFFLSIVNLNAGLPLCFFNGMNELWKVGLSLLFPLYLLAIVAILIVLSRYSLRLSNRIADSSVQVLVTVVHLSFSKLLLTIIDVFTPAEVYVNNFSYRVWFFDGSVEYASTSHFVLMILTVTIVTSLLLPYVLLLLFAKPLRRTKMNKYVQPLLEAIHAPYKEDKQYWFVAQLFLIIVLYMVYAFYRPRNIFYLYIINNPLGTVYLLLHVYCKPFKSKAINILYSWIAFNSIFISLTSWPFLISYHFIILKRLVYSAVYLVIVTFVLIVFYHILWTIGKLPLIQRKINSCAQLFRKTQHRYQLQINSINYDSFYGSNNYREPLVSSMAH